MLYLMQLSFKSVKKRIKHNYLSWWSFSFCRFELPFSVVAFFSLKSFSISSKVDVLAVNYVSLCISGIILRLVLLDVEFSAECFYFSILNISSHCLLNSTVYDERSSINLLRFLVHMELLFSLGAFQIFSVFILQLSVDLYRCRFL